MDKLIESWLKNAQILAKNIKIVFVCNLKTIEYDNNDYPATEVKSEYFSLKEIDQLLTSVKKMGFRTELFTDTKNFIKYLSNGPKEKICAYLTTQRGIFFGKNSLLPSICDFYNVDYIYNNAYIASLLNNKYHYTKLLQSHGLLVPQSFCFSADGWINDLQPPNKMKVIAKLSKECASIGLTNDSVFYFDANSVSKLETIRKTFSQDLIVQKFIAGYEVEVPIIVSAGNVFAPIAVGLMSNGQKNLDNEFYTYESIFDDDYDFYNFETIDKQMSCKIKQAAVRAAKIFGMNFFGRIDFRVTESEAFIIDCNQSPHIVEHSSFAFMYKELGFGEQDVLPSLIGKLYSRPNL